MQLADRMVADHEVKQGSRGRHGCQEMRKGRMEVCPPHWNPGQPSSLPCRKDSRKDSSGLPSNCFPFQPEENQHLHSLASFPSRRPPSSTPDKRPRAAARLLQDLFTASHLVPCRSLLKYSLDSSYMPINFSKLSPPRYTTS